jgi:hypothetical protein
VKRVLLVLTVGLIIAAMMLVAMPAFAQTTDP